MRHRRGLCAAQVDRANAATVMPGPWPHSLMRIGRPHAPQTSSRIAVDEVLAEVVQQLLAKRWNSEQTHELRVLFAEQPSRWLCKETICQAIYDAAVAITRPARRRRRRRRLLGLQRRGRLTAMRMIAERPPRSRTVCSLVIGRATCSWALGTARRSERSWSAPPGS